MPPGRPVFWRLWIVVAALGVYSCAPTATVTQSLPPGDDDGPHGRRASQVLVRLQRERAGFMANACASSNREAYEGARAAFNAWIDGLSRDLRALDRLRVAPPVTSEFLGRIVAKAPSQRLAHAASEATRAYQRWFNSANRADGGGCPVAPDPPLYRDPDCEPRMDAGDCGALQEYLGGDTESLMTGYYYSSAPGRQRIADTVETLRWPAFDSVVGGSR